MQPYTPYKQLNNFNHMPQQPIFAPGPPTIRIQCGTPLQSSLQLNHTQRIMYKSTIQPTSTPFTQTQNFGFSKLEAMGRTIKQQTVEPQQMGNSYQGNGQNASQTLKFRSDRPQRSRMAASVIYFNKNTEGNSSFTGFGNSLQPPQNNNGFNGFSGLESLASRARTVQEEEIADWSEEKNINSKWTGPQKNNRQMFKSSIDSSNRTKSFSSMSGLNFQNTVAGNNFKKFQFHRNKGPAVNVNTPQEKSVAPEKSFNKQITPFKQVLSQVKVSPSTTGQKVIPTGSNMMKKKNPIYPDCENNGKTDQTLLKMLGLNIKSGQKDTILSPKAFENVSLETKQPAKLIEPVIQPTKVKNQVKQQVSPKNFSKSDFMIGKKMGKGQFGEVHLVQHKLTGFICGMKTMSKKEIKSQKYQNQIARQLSIQFYLSHRHITPLYGYFQDEQNIYLLVEFCTDGQLLEKLRKDRRMEQADVSPIIRQICEGLNYIHKEQIIHRDVKPENIMFSFGTVKIGDFGWAVHSGNGMRRTISGSPLYYSPQIVQETAYDQKIDIWSIGMMTYQCLLGKIPFRIYSQLDLNRIVSDDISFPEYVDVSDQAKDFILKIMKKKPEERMEMREILRHPFITKYIKDRKIGSNVLEEFKNTLKL